MTKKVVNEDFNISDMGILSIVRHYLRLNRLPVIDIAEGPKIKYLFELYCLHSVGRILVKLDLKFSEENALYTRVKNSLVFRFKHYRNQKVIKNNSKKTS